MRDYKDATDLVVTGPTLRAQEHGHQPCGLRMRSGCPGGGKGALISEDRSLTLGCHNDQTLMAGQAVRRLTPLECERLQGFPDFYTAIPGASDTARYKALGNSMAVPVMRWIGKRIMATDQ